MDYVQIALGLLPTASGLVLGTISVYYGGKWLQNRLVSWIYAVLTGYIVELLADITEHPEKIQPVINSVMKSVLGNPNGVIPKEATVKIPILGKVPASWFEPLIKKAVGMAENLGTETVKEKIKHPFDHE